MSMEENKDSLKENLSIYESLLGMSIDSLSKDEITTILSEMKYKEKKKIELAKHLLDLIKANKQSDIKAMQERKFFSHFKLDNDNRNRIFYTVSPDTLSPTMYAFYLCDKSNQNISDKEAAAMKAMRIDSNYDLSFEKKKEEDEQSDTSNIFNNDAKLKKKRKNSEKMNFQSRTAKKKKRDNTNGGGDDNKKKGSNEEENEYCIQSCTIGRKNPNAVMICCDRCETWFHAKCMNVAEELINKMKEMEWYCPECKKKKEKESINNNNNNNNSN